METLYAKLADILEVDNVKPTDVLQDFQNWDSLTVLSVLATLDASYGVHFTAGELKELLTAGDLSAAVLSRTHK